MLDQKKIKQYSIIGQRAAFGLCINDLAKERDNLVVVTADVSTSAGLDRFKKNFPNNYFDVGIAEQILAGVSAGLSYEGYNVVSTTFAPFQTMRCLEQIKLNSGYMKLKIIYVGLASGICLGNLGFSHCSIEEIGALRSIPNLNIFSPCDTTSVYSSLKLALQLNNSSYIRLTGDTKLKLIYSEEEEFSLGGYKKIIQGKDILILSSGAIIKEAYDATIELHKEGIECSLIDMYCLKPIDEQALSKTLSNYKVILTLEEHNIIGGLSSIVSELIAKKNIDCKFIPLGINDKYVKSGSYEFLKKIFMIDKEAIINILKSNVQ